MYEYTLKRSRRKTLRLEITRELDILIRAPLHCPQREIDRFAARHADWGRQTSGTDEAAPGGASSPRTQSGGGGSAPSNGAAHIA